MKWLLLKLILLATAALAVASFAAGAAAVWLLLRHRGRRRQARLARQEREQASRRAWALEVERQLTPQAAPPPPFSRGALTSNGFISVQAVAAEADAAANDLEAAADAQALDELLLETEPALAEVEVLQDGLEADQAGREPVVIDLAALPGRAGALDLPASAAEDDLILIDGIGPVFADRLRQHGIMTFAGLAQLSEAELAELIQTPAWRRPDFSAWIHEAAQRAAAPVADGSPITP
jgi:predicted flap endonuclease-1-like 5' DNA nuclease